jgi:hypothetical protein
MTDAEHCELCEETDGLTGINGRLYCRAHLDQGLEVAVMSIQKFIRVYTGEDAEQLKLSIENHPSN